MVPKLSVTRLGHGELPPAPHPVGLPPPAIVAPAITAFTGGPPTTFGLKP
jgi:hypothetical protein